MAVEKSGNGKKDSEIIEIPVGRYINRMRSNLWIVSTIILAIVVIVLIFVKSNSTTGAAISENEAGIKVLNLAKAQLGDSVKLNGVNKKDFVYEVMLSVPDQGEVPVYVTLDGDYLANPLTNPDGTGSDSGTDTGTGIGGVVDVSADDDAVLGNKNAPVTLIEFSDYQCPFCRKFWQDTFPQIKKDYIDTGKAKFIYRDFPLSFHPLAIPAAEAAECAREKGGDAAYYKMHDKIFSEQNKLDGGSVKSTVFDGWDEAALKKWAKELGYDISSCMASGKYADEIQKDMQDGQSYGISGTPGFFVNGKMISGAVPYSQFKQVIDGELAG